LTREQPANTIFPIKRGELLAHEISFALGKAQKVVRGLWLGLTENERWEVARKTVEHLKEHGDKWRLNEEVVRKARDAASGLTGREMSSQGISASCHSSSRFICSDYSTRPPQIRHLLRRTNSCEKVGTCQQELRRP
jgi:hypothetical protein